MNGRRPCLQIKAGGYNLEVQLRTAPPPRRIAILLHGFAGTGADWDAVQPAFAKETSTATLDLPGHGASPAPADPKAFTFDAIADALWEVADAVGAQAPIWVGYSMGARILLYFAVRHPSRVGGLILESVHPGLEGAQDRERRAAQDREDAEMIERQGLAAFFEAWHQRPVFDSRRRNTDLWREEVAKRLRTNQPKVLASYLRGVGLGAMPPLHRRLQEIKVPVLLLAGTLDAPYMQEARAAAELLPDAKFKAVLNAGHAVHRENPGGYIEAVRDFLELEYKINPARGL